MRGQHGVQNCFKFYAGKKLFICIEILRFPYIINTNIMFGLLKCVMNYNQCSFFKLNKCNTNDLPDCRVPPPLVLSKFPIEKAKLVFCQLYECILCF